jgi:DNA-binding transcriptional MerR regulator
MFVGFYCFTKKSIMETQKIYTRKEFAKVLNVSFGTLRNWEKSKVIDPPTRIARRVYFTEAHLQKIFAQ